MTSPNHQLRRSAHGHPRRVPDHAAERRARRAPHVRSGRVVRVHRARVVGARLSALEDQQLAGLIMWIPGSIVWLGVGLSLAAALLSGAEARSRSRALRAGAALSAGLVMLLGACHPREPPPLKEGRIERTGEKRMFRFELVVSPASPAVGEHFEIKTTLRDGTTGALVCGAKVLVDATMPQHGHGMTTAPEHVALGEGRYVTRGLNLHMPGRWTIRRDGGAGRAGCPSLWTVCRGMRSGDRQVVARTAREQSVLMGASIGASMMPASATHFAAFSSTSCRDACHARRPRSRSVERPCRIALRR
jgi:hypothetical protein